MGMVLPALPVSAQTPAYSAPSAAQLIAEINTIRSGYGVLPLELDGILMGTAFSTAQYMATTGSCAHIGDIRGRIIAAGYGDGNAFATENISCGNKTLDQITYSDWADEAHMLLMKDPNYRSIGAGVAESGGLYYFVVHAAYSALGTYSSSSGSLNQTGNQTVTVVSDSAQTVVSVEKSNPKPDGSIVHKVQPGQSPWAIAVIYGIQIKDLVALNPGKLSETNLVLYPGEELLIRLAFTPTVSPTITLTPIPPTRTPQPTYTMRPTKTPAATLTATEKPLLPDIPALKSGGASPVGLFLIVVCGFGLILVIAASFRK